MPNPAAPAFRKSIQLSRFTPPVGNRRICGKGPFNSFIKPGPDADAGKTFTRSAPSFAALYISVGVYAPGKMGIFLSAQVRITVSTTTGVTIKPAPASSAASRSSGSHTVPAPMFILLPYCAQASRIIPEAPGLFIVISILVKPAA